eukprot:snap_masked-scaffold277_size226016-processed-gene-0.12 protein:Tk10749 transcript:snap_masked-scaffold277_size226016-processed-gene-0.12-mRNA-1 annotation:"conserved hypothetical protein"
MPRLTPSGAGNEARQTTKAFVMRPSLSSSRLWVVLVAAAFISTGVNGGKMREANYHVATGNQMVMRQDDGQVKFGVNTDKSYRSEMRLANGDVKGVYSWLKPDGSPHTLAYASDANGYRALPLNQMGLQLPTFPFSLYHAGQTNPRTREYVQNDMVVIEALPRASQFYDIRGNDQGPVKESEPFPPPGDDAVLVGQDNEEGPIPGEDVDGPPDSGFVTEAFDGFIKIPIRPGQSVAQALPEASSIAGDFGIAQASPSATAIAGPGGIAISLPQAEAISGNGGLALGSTQANSQVQDHGVAVSGGNTLAIAGVRPSGPNGFQNTEKNVSVYTYGGPNSPSISVHPVVSNYFFGTPPYTQQYAYHHPTTQYTQPQMPYHYGQPLSQTYQPYGAYPQTGYRQRGNPSYPVLNQQNQNDATESRSGDFYPLPFSKLSNSLARTYEADDGQPKKFHPKKFSVSRRTYATGE